MSLSRVVHRRYTHTSTTPATQPRKGITSTTSATTSGHGRPCPGGAAGTPNRSRASAAMAAGSPRRSRTVRTAADEAVGAVGYGLSTILVQSSCLSRNSS
jgi:hypothetical protein